MLKQIALVALIAMIPAAQQAPVGPRIGEPAPGFTLPDTHGQTHDLASYRGQWVVLEWLNYGCPYVVKHYRTGNIPGQQERWGERGVVWLAIVSSAPGTQGYYEPAEMNAESEKAGSRATAVLLDPEGTVGRAYEARTTPQMFVIDPEGRVVYMGGIDDIATARDEDLERATQYVDQALTEGMAGQPISVPISRPYGCSVKYAS
jgi:alkyl hydroperoxide reductase subunit AhpC